MVGRGRLGKALSAALRHAGLDVEGPLGRGASAAGSDIVILCVPDREIAAAASLIAPRPLLGHCSGASTLAVLAPHEAFSIHPLMTVSSAVGRTFAGAAAAIAGSTPRSLLVAEMLARRLEMRPLFVPDDARDLYHAAASMASNYLVTLEHAAERLFSVVGVDRAAMAPLVLAAAENWAVMGGEQALTGPIARGDVDTVVRQRAAVAQRAPDLLPLWDALAEATRSLAAARTGYESSTESTA